MVSRSFSIALVLLLAACSSTPPSAPSAPPAGRTEPAADQDTVPAIPAPATPAISAPAAVQQGQRGAGESLLTQAAAALARGDQVAAEALLQRAQRLDPSNPDVYLALAELNLARGELRAARSMAERGLLFCGAGECAQLRSLSGR